MAKLIHSTWQEALQKLDGAYAQNTIDAYYRDTRKFVDWCATKNYDPFPLQEAVMVEFLQSMVEDLSRSTIDRRLASVRRVNRLLGFTTQTGEAFRIAHRKMKRAKPHHRRQAHGINEDLLLRDTCLDQPIGDRRANQIIKLAVCRVRGHRPRDGEISGHSLRVGAAQDLLIKGFDTAAIMRAGGWRSLNALTGYLDLAEHNVWK